MIRSVVREHHWPPEIIGGFFVDDHDYQGIEYWYNDVKQINEDLKKEIKKK